MRRKEGVSLNSPYPQSYGGYDFRAEGLPVGVLLENLRADVVSLDKVLTEGTRQNYKEHEELFERVWFLEDESHKSLATLVAEGGGGELIGRVIKPWKTSSRGGPGL